MAGEYLKDCALSTDVSDSGITARRAGKAHSGPAGNAGIFRDWYVRTLEERLRGLKMGRADFWSKAVAVGDQDWLGRKAGECGLKRFRIVSSDSVHYLIGKCP